MDFVLSKLGLIVKPCTQEYELLTNSSGVSNGAGKGDWPSTFRMYDEWRASMVKIAPAAVRYLSAMEAAAPR